MAEDYKCRICKEGAAKNIMIVIYQNYRDYSFSHENLVCDDHDCIRAMGCSLSEDRRDRSVRIYPLRFESLHFLPIPERKRLEGIIIGAVSYNLENRAEQQPGQTSQDKPTAREPSQGELFHTPEESH